MAVPSVFAQLSRRTFVAATIGTILLPFKGRAEGTTSVNFRRRLFVHRWSHPSAGLHEFTPDAETDLSKWVDMVSVNVYDHVHDGDALAVAANRVLSNYQSNGKILRTLSKPRTAEATAEHFISAVLRNAQLLEAVFIRLMLRESVGYSVVYSHRLYGAQVGNEMAAWLTDNGSAVEAALLNWTELPPLENLKALR